MLYLTVSLYRSVRRLLEIGVPPVWFCVWVLGIDAHVLPPSG